MEDLETPNVYAAKDPRFAAIWNSLKEFRTSYRELARTMWPWE